MSFVERFIILCPYLGVSTIGGFTVHVHVVYTCNYMYYIIYVWSAGITFEYCTRYSTHCQVNGCGLSLSCFNGHAVTSIIQQLMNGLTLIHVCVYTTMVYMYMYNIYFFG